MGIIINNKILIQARILIFNPQQSYSDRMESAHGRKMLNIFSQKFSDSFLHLPCCLVCKSHSEYVSGVNIHHRNILAVTFTNKAAGEMKERITKLLGKDIEHLPTMGTFHSIGVRLLRIEYKYTGLDQNFVIYDNSDQESLLKDILLRLTINPTKYKPSLFSHI